MSLFKRPLFNRVSATEITPQLPSDERLDQLYSFMSRDSRKILRRIADADRAGDAFSDTEALEIRSVKESYLKELEESGQSYTTAEVNALLRRLLGQEKSSESQADKFDAFKKILDSTHLDAMETLKFGITQSGMSAEDQFSIRRMKNNLIAQVVAKKFPFTPEEVSSYVDRLVEPESLPNTNITIKPSYIADRPRISDDGMDTIAAADISTITPERKVGASNPGTPRPDAALAPLEDADIALLRSLGVPFEESAASSKPKQTGVQVMAESAYADADFLAGFDALLEERGLKQHPSSVRDTQ